MKLIEIDMQQVTTKKNTNANSIEKIRSFKKNERNDDPDEITNRASANGNHKITKLGIGADAIVYHNNKPSAAGIVTKWILTQPVDMNRSGTIQFYIQSNKQLDGNPFVPVVYSIKQVRNGNNDQICDYIVKMEKLHPIKNLDLTDPLVSSALIDSVLEPISDNEQETELPAGFNGRSTFIKIIRLLLVDGSRQVKYRGVMRTINSNLERVADLIDNIVYTNMDSSHDIHMNNVMIRLTSTGPQLVVNDPITETGVQLDH